MPDGDDCGYQTLYYHTIFILSTTGTYLVSDGLKVKGQQINHLLNGDGNKFESDKTGKRNELVCMRELLMHTFFVCKIDAKYFIRIEIESDSLF